MRFPLAIYRTKFDEKFDISQLSTKFSYLHALGISDVSGDLSSELLFSIHFEENNTQSVLQKIQTNLQDNNLAWIQDICLHYIHYDCNNYILRSIWEYGMESPYFPFLDMEWNSNNPNLKGKLLAPFLARPYSECLECGQIQLQYNQNGISVAYGEWSFPIKIASYFTILSNNLPVFEQTVGKHHPDLIKFMGILYMFQSVEKIGSYEGSLSTVSLCKNLLWEFYQQNPYIHSFIQDTLAIWNGKIGVPTSFDLLDELLSTQFFRLSFYKLAYEEINYRTWDNDIRKICLNLNHPKVFRHIQTFLLKWLPRQSNWGLRIIRGDAICNLAEYCQLFHSQIPYTYWVAEKKWNNAENLMCIGHIQGAVSLDFYTHLQKIFSYQATSNVLSAGYLPFAHTTADFALLQKEYRKKVLDSSIMGEMVSIYDALQKGLQYCRWARDISRSGLFRSLIQIFVELHKPLQNLDRLPQQQKDKAELQSAISNICQQNNYFEHHCRVIEKYILAPNETLNLSNPDQQPIWQNVVRRLQQISSLIIHKSIQKIAEDYPGLMTASLLVEAYQRPTEKEKTGRLNIVEHINTEAEPIEKFHEWEKWLQENFPKSWNTSNENPFYTEDSWARLEVLSEIPEIWGQTVQHWAQCNQTAKLNFHGEFVPNPDFEYFIYQSLLAICPFQQDNEWISQAWDWIQLRLQNIQRSKTRETHKLGYFHAIRSFVAKILYPSADNFFWPNFLIFYRKISHYGLLNSLAQTLIKLTCPGIPEIHEDNEVWNFGILFSKESKENEWKRKQELLQSWKEFPPSHGIEFLEKCWLRPEDGRIKLWTIYKGLQLRKQYTELFQQGNYIPTTIQGTKAQNLISFYRSQNKTWLFVVVPRWNVNLVEAPNLPVGEEVWKDTNVVLPNEAPLQWRNVLTNENIMLQKYNLPISQALAHFPVGLWLGEKS